ncbi:MAG: Rpn family recombination-promoting nuclease/putative transposase [Oscillospiraceae bacterium]|nr:Rpn family recombination-promoting nuclease/putative transposase [Oscillospiraceae bacterium]
MAKANRALKDSVFTNLFGERQAFLELYSALLGVELPPDVHAEDVTLDQVLFLDRVNDLAYLVGDTVVILVEHQSTVNPNMPLRFLMYVAGVYEKLIDDDKQYSHKLLRIPKPVFIVLYNGDEPYPEQVTLRLSDAFMEAGQLLPAELTELASLELEVKVYNVNVDKNRELVRRSRVFA